MKMMCERHDGDGACTAPIKQSPITINNDGNNLVNYLIKIGLLKKTIVPCNYIVNMKRTDDMRHKI